MAALSVKPRPPLEETSEMSVRDDDVLRPAREYQIISRPFAGRVGGNQHFTIEADTSEKDSLLQRIPDAAPYLTWRESFDLRPFREVELWKQAAVEGYEEQMLNWDASDLYLGLLEWMGGYHEWKHGRVRSLSIVHVHLAALPHAWVQDHQVLHRISEEIFVFSPAFPQLFRDSIHLLLLPLFAYAVNISDTLYCGTPLRNLLANIIGEGELVLSIALLVYATAPVTGGHMNPMVTTATFLARLTSVPRAMLYIISQVIGAAIGAWLIRSSYGSKLPPEVFGGCYVDPTLVTPAQAYVFETMGSVAVLYLLFGTGIDPHQKHCYGPAYSVILVACSFGLVSFISWPVKPGYSGVALNPARCFGLSTASENWDYHYLIWCGDLTAAVINGIYHWIVPAGKRK